MKKSKKLLGLVLSLSLAGSGVAYAASWEETEVNVRLNGTSLNFDGVGAHLAEGSVVAPLRQLADALRALVAWDDETKTAHIYKPNVHLLVAEDVTREEDGYTIHRPFGKIALGSRKKFAVLAQVDGLKTDLESFRIRVVAPDGSVAGDSEDLAASAGKDNFWTLYGFGIEFNQAGEYRVQLLMKLPGEDRVVVSEKAILAE